MENKIEKVTESFSTDQLIPVNTENSYLSGAVFFTLCTILIFSSLAYGTVDPWAFGFLSVLTGVIVIFWIADAWKSKELILSTNLLQISLVGIILIGAIQLLPLRDLNISGQILSIPADKALSFDPYSTKLAIIKYVIFLVFFSASLTFINTPNRLRKIVYTIIIFAAFMAFYGILQNLAGAESIYGLRPTPHANPFSAYVNRHHFAAFMEMGIGLTLGLLFVQGVKRDKFLLLIIAVFLMGIAVVMTGSRGGFISLIGILIVLIFLTLMYGGKSPEHNREVSVLSKNNIVVVASSFLLVLALLGITLWLGANNTLEYAVNLQAEGRDYSNGRLHFWSTALKIIQDHPIIGTGLDSFGVTFTKYDTWNGNLRLEYAHNDYLQTLSDSGIIGLLFVLFFIFLLFRQSLRIIRTATDRFRQGAAIGALAGCSGILLHSLFDFPLRTNANSLFFLAFAAIAVNSIPYPKLFRKRVKVRKKRRKPGLVTQSTEQE